MGERAGSRYKYDWVRVALPLTPKLQREHPVILPELKALKKKVPLLEIIPSAKLKIDIVRLIIRNMATLADVEDILRSKVDVLCGSRVVLEEPRISYNHPANFCLDLSVTGSNELLFCARNLRRDLIDAAGGEDFQIKGEEEDFRCTIAMARKNATPQSEMEDAVGELGALTTLVWPFTPDNLVLFRRFSAESSRAASSEKFKPRMVPIAA